MQRQWGQDDDHRGRASRRDGSTRPGCASNATCTVAASLLLINGNDSNACKWCRQAVRGGTSETRPCESTVAVRQWFQWIPHKCIQAVLALMFNFRLCEDVYAKSTCVLQYIRRRGCTGPNPDEAHSGCTHSAGRIDRRAPDSSDSKPHAVAIRSRKTRMFPRTTTTRPRPRMYAATWIGADQHKQKKSNFQTIIGSVTV